MVKSHYLHSSEDEHDTLGGRLLRARDAANLTVSETAHRLGVKPSTLQAWESDRSEPRSNKLTMAAGILNVSPAWLLIGKGEGPSAVSQGEIDMLSRELSAAVREMEKLQSKILMISNKLAAL